MNSWGMPETYVPSGILLMKPFEYKTQARSLKTSTTTATWRDGNKYTINDKPMGNYYFFADVGFSSRL
jgi:hypothetical protein